MFYFHLFFQTQILIDVIDKLLSPSHEKIDEIFFIFEIHWKKLLFQLRDYLTANKSKVFWRNLEKLFNYINFFHLYTLLLTENYHCITIWTQITWLINFNILNICRTTFSYSSIRQQLFTIMREKFLYTFNYPFFLNDVTDLCTECT